MNPAHLQYPIHFDADTDTDPGPDLVSEGLCVRSRRNPRAMLTV